MSVESFKPSGACRIYVQVTADMKMAGTIGMMYAFEPGFVR